MISRSTRTAPGAWRPGAVVTGVVAMTTVVISLGASTVSAQAVTASASQPVTAVGSTLSLGSATPSLAVVPLSTTSPHGPYGTMTVDSCAVCHRAHTAQNSALLVKSATQSTLCLSCHDGTGASTDVASEYGSAKPNVPSKDTPTGTMSYYYQHDATVPTTHTLSVTDEFSGVLNRHTECSDCHDPHSAAPTDVRTPAAGVAWPLSGRLTGVSGVAVTNGSAGASPTYRFLDGKTSKVSFEYQLCLKCHSGFTKLLANDNVSPNSWTLDAGVEFNPANASFHPVEGSGTNTTQKMKDSLAGGSLWRFSVDGTDGFPSTVRCTNCHANSAALTTPSDPSDARAPHASANRGILLRPYRDRDLKPSTEPYASGDFALCFLCHSSTPFGTDTAADTNFNKHFKHVSALDYNRGGNSNTSLNIDTPGAGQGNALCSECHYRTHSTATGSNYPRLVNFAPDVLPYGANDKPIFRVLDTGSGTCTLVCHGAPHNNVAYYP